MITLNIQAVLVWLLLIFLIVATGFLIVVLKNLVDTVKKTNKILDDTTVVTTIVAEKTEEVEETMDNLISVANKFSGAVNGKEGLITSLVSISKGAFSTANVVKKSKKNCKRRKVKKVVK